MRILILFLSLSISQRAWLQPVSKGLLCDTASGMCIPAEVSATGTLKKNILSSPPATAPLTILYFTDPICSTCWGIEPVMRRLKLEYGHLVDIKYLMGGLLPKWEGFNGGGITKPSDVAHHWDEVSNIYHMPIDGNVWLEDPLPSSYPPSAAYLSATLQDDEKAHVFLRRMKEMVFMEKQNICRWPVQARAALYAGLDTSKLRTDIATRGNALLQTNLQQARSLNVRGFPTLFFGDASGNRLTLYGYKPYEQFVSLIKVLYPEATPHHYARNTEELFHIFPTLTLREAVELSQLPEAETKQQLLHLISKGIIREQKHRNGNLYVKIEPGKTSR